MICGPGRVGGAGQFTAALVDRLTARGGRIVYSSPVERVLVGRAY